MNFGKLFGKKDGGKKAPKPDKNEQTQLMLDQKIKEQELRLNNLETRTNALQDEAKAKLKAGDKAGAKRILAKKKKLVEQMKQIEGAMAMMEEQKMMLDNTLQMKDVMQAIKAGNEAVKVASQGMSVDDLQDMKDQMDEVKADQEELNNFFKDYAEENKKILKPQNTIFSTNLQKNHIICTFAAVWVLTNTEPTMVSGPKT